MKISKFREATSSIGRTFSDSKKKFLSSRNQSDFERKTLLFVKKIFLVLKKNYYIATRNPKLYVSMILAPLLFVILIGMAFNTSQLREGLGVSIYDESPDALIYNVFSNISNVRAILSDDVDDCMQATIDKVSAVCITIVENERDSFDADIYFDYSRMSVYPTAYTTIREVFSAFEQEVTMSILNELRNRVNPDVFGFEFIKEDLSIAKEELLSASDKINSLAKSLSSDSDFYKYKIDEVIQNLSSVESQISSHQVLINNYRTEINAQKSDAENIYIRVKNVREDIEVLVNECGASGEDFSSELDNSDLVDLINSRDDPGCSSVKTIHGTVKNYENSFKSLSDGLNAADRDLGIAYESLEDLKLAINLYILELEREKQQINETEVFYSSEIIGFQNSLLEHSNKIVEYSELVDNVSRDVAEFHASLDPREIINQFEKNFRLLSGSRSMLDYSLHLVVPFILLLSSLLISITLNRNEYKTSAFQRNKMLKNNFLIFSGNTLFVLFVMLLELLFILLLFNLFFGSDTLSNLPLTMFFASLFILIWIIVGFIISRFISSDEGSIFSGIVLGLIVFFLSDVIVPAESFPSTMLFFYKLNPFVYFSDIMRSNYIIEDMISVFSYESMFLLFAFIIVLIISLIIVWRDMYEHHS